ncbi:MAG: DUF4830 domain-containing protein [Eubacterium sp.]|nr:DUF4830 domain-containing protein [Eubacterium sp.]
MQVVTFKAKPRTVFGAVLALTGLIVILLTFITNHPAAPAAADAAISCATADERAAYIRSLGWEFDTEEQREITIPEEWNDVYRQYNDIQKKQGFDLESYKGSTATIYTYSITNYEDNDKVIADLIVCDGKLIGADLCDPAAKGGFLTQLEQKDETG